MKTTSKVSIIGYGWVGKAMKNLFLDAIVYDPSHIDSCTRDEANQADIAFVCVPTPHKEDDTLDTTIVEETVAWLACPLIVIRSTVNPKTCQYLAEKYHKRIVYQPEYLGESPAHPFLDMKTRPFIVLGGENADRRQIIELYTSVYNANVSIRQVSLYEAEVIKLAENRAIAFKVMECHELYQICEKAGVDYYTIRDTVYGDDPRFNLWFTFIYPRNLGFNSSKCLKKDVPAFCAWSKSQGYEAEVTQTLVNKSNQLSTCNDV